MKNRLSHCQSPYLQQHSKNPVSWQPWGDEALSLARKENKPIFLSSGYSSCHWCHVMEKESFSDPKIAEILNKSFVPIKLDREERPDIDALYMKAVQVLTGQGGWPLNVFLTPELRPFFGGTYFPPEARYNLPAFADLLRSIAETYANRFEEVRQNADQLSNILFQSGRYFEEGSAELDESWVGTSIKNIQAQTDSQYAGLGEAPKFFHTEAYRLLLRSGDAESISMLNLFLDQICRGGIFDHVGGGLHRYSTDREWKTPHYEKMLYDNALVTELLVESFQKQGRWRDKAYACFILDWCIEEMQSPQGLFYSSQDADTENAEGAFYFWSDSELKEVLSDSDNKAFRDLFILEGGIRLKKEIADQKTWDRYRHLMKVLYEARSNRTRPGVDTKIQTSWNSLLIKTLIKAGTAFDRKDYLATGVMAIHQIWERAWSGSVLRHLAQGEQKQSFLEDTAYFGEALLEAHEATQESIFLDRAKLIADSLLNDFYDSESGGFWVNSKEQKDIVFRFKEIHDSALPSPFTRSISFLSRLFGLTGDVRFQEAARKSLHSISASAKKEPGGFQSLALWLHDQKSQDTQKHCGPESCSV